MHTFRIRNAISLQVRFTSSQQKCLEGKNDSNISKIKFMFIPGLCCRQFCLLQIMLKILYFLAVKLVLNVTYQAVLPAGTVSEGATMLMFMIFLHPVVLFCIWKSVLLQKAVQQYTELMAEMLFVPSRYDFFRAVL